MSQDPASTPTADWIRSKEPFLSTGIAAACALLSFALSGASGLAGFALGVAGTAANLLGLWMVVRLLGKTSADVANHALGTALAATSFVLALPAILAAMMVSHRLGGASDRCFLAGLALVYCRLIGQGLLTK